MITKVLTLCAVLLAASVASAGVIDFSQYQQVGSYTSEGLYDLSGLGSWNGQPVSPTNKPSDHNRQLSATWNLFVNPAAHNELFIQVTDVITTNGAWWVGLAFENVSLTGLRFTLPHTELGTPSLNSGYANAGELLFTGNHEETIPLLTTPGYMLSALGGDTFSIHTASGADYAFGTWGYVDNAHRIMGGGVFDLTFDPGVDLLLSVYFPGVKLDSIYGVGNQYIAAEWQPPDTEVPEPGTLCLMLLAGACLALRKTRIPLLSAGRGGRYYLPREEL